MKKVAYQPFFFAVRNRVCYLANLMNIWPAIDKVCAVRGLSPRALASRAGISKSVIYAYQSGASSPSVNQASALAKALGVRPFELFLLADAIERDIASGDFAHFATPSGELVSLLYPRGHISKPE